MPAYTISLAPSPWWRHGMVWMVIAGPALVVAASMVTLWLAITRPEVMVDEDYYRKGIEINKTLEQPSLAPAMLARNHAATPAAPVPAAPVRH